MIVAAVMAVRINPKMSATLLIMLPIIICYSSAYYEVRLPNVSKDAEKG